MSDTPDAETPKFRGTWSPQVPDPVPSSYVPAPRASVSNAPPASPTASSAYAAVAGVPSPSLDVEAKLGQEMGSETDYKSVIKVSDPELRGTNMLNKHHSYKITTPTAGVAHVFRRYKDFDWLRLSLVRMYPGIFVAPLPPKKMVGSLEESFVAERRVDLERFLNRLQQSPTLCLANSPMFKMFLQRAATFEDGVKDLNKMLDTRSIQDTLHEYSELFPDIMKKEIEDRNKTNLEVAALFEFLVAQEEKLTGLHASARSLLNSSNSLTKDITALAGFLEKTYTLEKGFPDRPQPNRVDVQTEFTEWGNEKKNSTAAIYHELVSAFKYELMDIEAFLEVLKNRQAIVVRRNKAVEKAKVWKLPETLVDTEKKEQQRAADLAAEKDENDLVDALTKLILHSQMGQFWRNKVNMFRSCMSRFAKAQSLFTTRQQRHWAAAFGRTSDGLSEHDLTRSVSIVNPAQTPLAALSSSGVSTGSGNGTPFDPDL